MTCEGCANPHGGIVITGCRQCSLRELARGPLFFESMRANKLLPAYRIALRNLGDEQKVHEEVKAMAKTLHVGAVQA